MAKTTPWIKIKAQYLEGVSPKELAIKYKIKAKQISDKAHSENWTSEKSKISEKIRENVKDKIDKLTDLALDTLKEIVINLACKDSDRVNAAKAILDVSGLKSSKQEITGKDGAPLAVQKVFVTKEQQKAVKKHIQDVINGASDI